MFASSGTAPPPPAKGPVVHRWCQTDTGGWVMQSTAFNVDGRPAFWLNTTVAVLSVWGCSEKSWCATCEGQEARFGSDEDAMRWCETVLQFQGKLLALHPRKYANDTSTRFYPGNTTHA
jgi:hypothetical protein